MATDKQDKVLNVPTLRFTEFSGEWHRTTIGECCSPLEYGMNAPAKEYDGKNKYIRITDIDEETCTYKYDDVVSPNALLEEKYKVLDNDILFARTGASTGKAYLYDKKDGLMYYAGFLIRGNVKPDFNSKFVFLQTQTQKYKKWVDIMSIRSGQPGINSQEYSSFKFHLPPSKVEQDKISTLFTLLDVRITTQIRIIDKLQSLMKGLNDYLQDTVALSYSLSFSDIGKDYSGLSGKSAEDFGSGKPYITYVSVYTNNFVDDDCCGKVSVGLGEKQNVVLKGDMLFTLSSETPEEVCYGAVYSGNNTETFLNSFCFGIRNTEGKVFSPYMAYFFNSSRFRREVFPLAQGSTRFNLQKSDFLQKQFSYPSIDDQHRIFEILNAYDNKIKVENQILANYRLQKEFLLSNLFI